MGRNENRFNRFGFTIRLDIPSLEAGPQLFLDVFHWYTLFVVLGSFSSPVQNAKKTVVGQTPQEGVLVGRSPTRRRGG